MKLTKEQAAIISAYTGILACDFSTFHEYAEKIMGRPVFTIELASEEFMKKLKEASFEDFIEICYDGKED